MATSLYVYLWGRVVLMRPLLEVLGVMATTMSYKPVALWAATSRNLPVRRGCALLFCGLCALSAKLMLGFTKGGDDGGFRKKYISPLFGCNIVW